MFRSLKTTARYLYFSAAFLFLFTLPAHAYIDPSVMTYAIQALAGIAIALGTFFGIYWRKIKKPLLKFFNLDESQGKAAESDALYYYDPAFCKEKRVIRIRESEKAKDTSGNRNGLMKDLLPALFMSLAGSFMICLYAPLDLYFNNKNEFWFDLPMLLPRLLLLFAITFLAVSAVFVLVRLIHKKIYHWFIFISSVIFICLYVQGTYRIGNLPAMDGTPIDWTLYRSEDIISAVILTAVLAVCLLIRKYVREKGYRSVIEVLSVLLLTVMSVSLAITAVSSSQTVEKDVFVVTEANEFTVSDKKNFYVLVLDALDAAVYTELSEEHPEYREWFRDFTFFPNTTSLYPYTSRSVAHLLTGKIYENEKDFTEYYTEALDQSEVIRQFEDNGYRMGLYETELSYKGHHLSRFDNLRIEDVSINPEFNAQFIKEQLKLSLFKYVPYCFKKYVRCNSNSFNEMTLPVPFTANNRTFYEDLQTVSFEHIEDNNFRFIHIEGAHVPFVYDKDVNVIPESEGTYRQNVEAGMTIAGEFIRRIKETGAYDNSVIIIMADHGYNDDSELTEERFNPLLMVKGFGEQHDYAVSHAPISFEDMPEAFKRLIAGSQSDTVFDAKEGDRRERRIMVLEFLQEDHIMECVQDGDAFDYLNIKPTGRVFDR